MRNSNNLRAIAGVVTLGALFTTTPANAAPIYPMLLVTVQGRAGQTPTFTIAAEAPTGWSCVPLQWGLGTFVVECTPPVPPQQGLDNTCIWNAVTVTTGGIPGTPGALYGQAQCDSDSGASASTTVPGSGYGYATPNLQFSRFYCRVDGQVFEPSMRPWTVNCTVNH